MLIGEDVTHGDDIFKNCIKLNQPIEIYSKDCSCAEMFKDCVPLETKNVTIHFRKRTRQLSVQRRLQEIWGTEEIKEGINIVYDETNY